MEVGKRARDGKLEPGEMQGGCMTTSSLGGIGVTACSPIVNAPEVAILGLTRSCWTPVRGAHDAAAAGFVAHLCRLLGDVRHLSL